VPFRVVLAKFFGFFQVVSKLLNQSFSRALSVPWARLKHSKDIFLFSSVYIWLVQKKWSALVDIQLNYNDFGDQRSRTKKVTCSNQENRGFSGFLPTFGRQEISKIWSGLGEILGKTQQPPGFSWLLVT